MCNVGFDPIPEQMRGHSVLYCAVMFLYCLMVTFLLYNYAFL